jgi:hypothetical protein
MSAAIKTAPARSGFFMPDTKDFIHITKQSMCDDEQMTKPL